MVNPEHPLGEIPLYVAGLKDYAVIFGYIMLKKVLIMQKNAGLCGNLNRNISL